MTHKEIHEGLVTLYLRLNGYFTAGFIVHSSQPGRAITELDVIGVRFPNARESEREVGLAPELDSPNSAIDLILCEVKGGISEGPQFNSALRTDPFAMAAVLRRSGVFKDDAVPKLAQELQSQLAPSRLAGSQFPIVRTDGIQARAILFATGRVSRRAEQAPFIHGQQVLDYIWRCLRPPTPRPACSTTYDYQLWGDPVLVRLVQYFKGRSDSNPGTVKECESAVLPILV